MNGTSIAVIGAGFSGTLLSLHLLRRCPPSTSVLLIERNSQFGRGQAYSTGNPNHLLNVPAAKMSAFGDRPLDFLSWLRTQAELGDGKPPSGACFVSRHLFGSYVRHLLNEELQGGRERLQLIRADVQALEPAGSGLRLLGRTQFLSAHRHETGAQPFANRLCHLGHTHGAIDIGRRAHLIGPAQAFLPALVDELLRC